MYFTVKACTDGSDILSSLQRDFDAGRLSHATLLTGDKGTGKKTLAHALACGLLCSSDGEKPCGECRECRRYLSRTHPDALFPAPAPREKTIKVDALREMIDTLSRHSFEGKRRVIVIENAERMTPQAQNCLLKTLEEAEEGTYFFLTADTETAILPTIRSRCRCVRMQPWPQQRIERALLNQGIPVERVKVLARYCEGSLGRALQMQQDEDYWQMRALVQRTFLSVQRPSDLPSAAQLLKDQKDNGDQLLDILEQEIRSLLHERVTGEEIHQGDAPELFSHATARGLRGILEAVLNARQQKNANVGWAALAEGLLQTISEETSKWQL